MKNSERTAILNHLNNNKIPYRYEDDVLTIILSVTEWDDLWEDEDEEE